MDGIHRQIDRAHVSLVTLSYLVQEIEAAHKLLDELSAPREDNTTPEGFTLVGRIKRIPELRMEKSKESEPKDGKAQDTEK